MSPLAPPFGHPRSGRKGFVPRLPILGTIDDLAANAGDTVVVLTFTAPVGAFAYLPQYKESTSGTWLDAANLGDLPSYPGASGLQVSGLTNTTQYDFRVKAFDEFTSTTSGTVQATPTAGSGFGTVSDLTVTAQTDTTMTVEWTQVDDGTGNPAKYAVRIRTPTIDSDTWGEAFPSNIDVDTNLAIGVTKSVQFTGLTAGTGYGAMLIPFRGPTGDADAFGSFSNVATGTTTGTSALGTISDLSASPGDGQVGLSWTPADNATSHQPQYKLSSSGTWLDFGSALGAGASDVTVTGLTNDSGYDFRIEASDGVTTTTSNVESATPSASAFPNEPAGFTQLRVWDGTALVPSGWSEADTGPAKHSREPESGLPSGYTHLYRHTYPQGMSLLGKGTEFLSTGGGGWFSSDTKRLYIHFRLRPDANWVGHPTGTNKVVYFGSNSGNGFANEFFFKMKGAGSNTLVPEVHLQDPSPGAPGTKVFSRNVGSATIPRGQFTRVEILCQANDVGVANGTLKVFIDGSLSIDYSGSDAWFEFFEDDRFTGFKFDSIYGGQSSGTLDAEQVMDIDDIYASGGGVA